MFLNGVGGSRKDKKMCKMTQEMGSQKRKGQMLTRLWESVWRKGPKLWPDKWIFHHCNTPAHDTLRACEVVAKKSITKMDHPPYSPDIVFCDFWLLPKLKTALKEQRFVDIPDIQRNLITLLQGMPENGFEHVFGDVATIS
jgi:hypothetical protein